ncbi:hypothetical protein HispidOSU_012312 [Sigmodon hispidus]
MRRDKAPVEDSGLLPLFLSPPSTSQFVSLKTTLLFYITRRVRRRSRRTAFEAANGCSGPAHRARPSPLLYVYGGDMAVGFPDRKRVGVPASLYSVTKSVK